MDRQQSIDRVREFVERRRAERRDLLSGVITRPPPGTHFLLRGGFSEWMTAGGESPPWRFEDDLLEVIPGTGDLVTRRRFESYHLHCEFRVPLMEEAEGQDRGNSGIYIDGRYELQILDSPGKLIAQDICGAIYGYAPPIKNAARAAGEWQSFDIAFRARTSEEPARVTVFHNGVLIHNNLALRRETPGALAESSDTARPIMLQDHGARVAFRNMWISEP